MENILWSIQFTKETIWYLGLADEIKGQDDDEEGRLLHLLIHTKWMPSFMLIYAFFPDTFVIIERLKKFVRKINSSVYYLLHKQEVANSFRISGRAFVRYFTAVTVK